MAETRISLIVLLIGILLQSVPSSQETSCITVDNIRNNENQVNPTGSEAFEKIGNSYYLLNTVQTVNWFKAAHICRSYNTNLVSIESAREFNALTQHINSTGHGKKEFWTSGNDLDVHGTFQWLGTGNTFGYSKWHTGQPDNLANKEHCVHLTIDRYLFEFNDNDCKYLAHYICERN